jgi:hypothetical protein
MSNTQVLIKQIHAFADATVSSGVTGQQPRQLPGDQMAQTPKGSSDQMHPAILNKVCRVLGSGSYVPDCANHI